MSLISSPRPIHNLLIYGHITHVRFKDGPSWKGPLLISRDPLLHFMEEEHEVSGGKVMCRAHAAS